MVGEKVAAGRRGAPHLTLTHTGPGGRAAFAGLALAYGALFVFDAADGGGRGHWLSWVLPFRLGIASWALLVVAAEGTLPVARAWWRELRALACVAMVVFEAVGVGFAAHLDGEAPGGPGRHNADLVVIVLVVAALAACRLRGVHVALVGAAALIAYVLSSALFGFHDDFALRIYLLVFGLAVSAFTMPLVRGVRQRQPDCAAVPSVRWGGGGASCVRGGERGPSPACCRWCRAPPTPPLASECG